MNKARNRFLFFMIIVLIVPSLVLGQRQTGSIKGNIIDNEGNPLPGAVVTIKSVSMMGTSSYLSSETGAFRFPSVPPGSYTITAEISGFKKVVRADVIVKVGMTVTLNISMEPAAIQEEIQVTAPSPTVDVESTKLAIVMDSNMLQNLPLARNLTAVINTIPGAVSSTFHGSTVRGSTYALDGVNINDPVTMTPMTSVNFDIIDEVEIITAGHPAEVGFTAGAYINVVTQSGGNKLSGSGLIYFTNDKMAKSVWTDEQLQALKVSKPSFDRSFVDGSLTFGGPIVKDKLWFFTNARYAKINRTSSFIGPFTDFLGRSHEAWEWEHEEKMGLAKITSQLSPKIKVMGMANYTNTYRPANQSASAYQVFLSTTNYDETSYTGTGILSYILNQNTFLELKLGLAKTNTAQLLQDEAKNLPRVYNAGSLYTYVTRGAANDEQLRRRYQGGLYFTHFRDKLLGGNHEFKGGLEFEDAYADWDIWAKENMTLYYRLDSPYYNDKATKWGQIYFDAEGTEKGSPQVIDRVRRFSAYVQDTMTIAKKLTLAIGFRFDRSWGWKPAVTKGAGNALSMWVGENVVKPAVIARYASTFPSGVNPFAEFQSPQWNDVMVWNTISPRLGVTYDPLGDGKTALKASFSRYTEYMMIDYFRIIHPNYPRTYGFFWWDKNDNAMPDTQDQWQELGYDYRFMSKDFLGEMLDPNTKSPVCDELSAGVWRELFKSFSVGANFIYKDTKNIFEDVMYNVDNGQYMYHPDQEEAKKWWIPFTTIIPAADNFPARTVTLYYQKLDSPGIWYRAKNVKELKRKYWATEFIFNKRMADKWQLSGSIVLSKSYGNAGMNLYYSRGWTGIVDRPNFFVNDYGRLDYDRPLVIKLMGTVLLPWRISLSGYYAYSSGAPWNRQLNIMPPADWCTKNNVRRRFYAVAVEPVGTYRLPGWNNFDMRLEKTFAIKDIVRIGAYIDILNVFGYTDVSVGVSNLYTYSPSAENTSELNNLVKSSSFKVVSGASGTRVVKACIRFSF